MTGDAPTAATLAELGTRIAEVSPDWAAKVLDAPTGTDEPTDAGAPAHVPFPGFEAIREGWLLHRTQSRLVAGASPDLALLIGDWCYAAGLCDVTTHGTLDDVALLADLIADLSTQPSTSTEDLAPRWATAQAALERKTS